MSADFKAKKGFNDYSYGEQGKSGITGFGMIAKDFKKNTHLAFGQMSESKLSGIGYLKDYIDKKTIYMGEFSNDKLDGYGLSFNSQTLQLGTFVAGVLNGLCVEMDKSGSFYVSNYKRGVKQNQVICYSIKRTTFFKQVLKADGSTEKSNVDPVKVEEAIALKFDLLDDFKFNVNVDNNKTLEVKEGGARSIFYGEVINKQMNGLGYMATPSGFYYGQTDDNEKTGFGILSGNGLCYYGSLSREEYSGMGLLKDSTGLFLGTFKHGKKNGVGFAVTEKEISVLTYEDDVPAGVGFVVDSNYNVTKLTYNMGALVDNTIISNGTGPVDNDNQTTSTSNDNKPTTNNVGTKPTASNNPSGTKDPMGGLTATEKELAKLIGLGETKKQLARIKALAVKNKGKQAINLHMSFYGNPGTGKTTVARLMGKILHEYGVLPSTAFIEGSRETLVAQYIGQTAPKVKEAVKKAMGGVLFIDEAYSLDTGSESDFGNEAVQTLLTELENNKGKFCCILAGYSNEMDRLFAMNPGFTSRVPFKIYFTDYNEEELIEITKLQLKNAEYEADDKLIARIAEIIYREHNNPNFANARDVRNIIQDLALIQATRTIGDLADRTFTDADLDEYITEKNITFDVKEVVPMVDYNVILEESRKHKDQEFNSFIQDAKEAVVALKMYDGTVHKGDGSGFIISADGYAVTCSHCVHNVEKVIARRRILDRIGNEVDLNCVARVVADDPVHDVAIIKLENDGDYYPHLVLQQEGTPELDSLTPIILAGYPFGVSRFDTLSINEGKVVSYQKMPRGEHSVDIINLDLAAKSGNSGSCIIDMKKGVVIGVLCGSNLSYSGRLTEEINYCAQIKYVWEMIKNNQKKEE